MTSNKSRQGIYENSENLFDNNDVKQFSNISNIKSDKNMQIFDKRRTLEINTKNCEKMEKNKKEVIFERKNFSYPINSPNKNLRSISSSNQSPIYSKSRVNRPEDINLSKNNLSPGGQKNKLKNVTKKIIPFKQINLTKPKNYQSKKIICGYKSITQNSSPINSKYSKNSKDSLKRNEAMKNAESNERKLNKLDKSQNSFHSKKNSYFSKSRISLGISNKKSYKNIIKCEATTHKALQLVTFLT